MAIDDNPNERQYNARNFGKYLSTRMLTHTGITIAFALGRETKDVSSNMFLDYSILNAAEESPTDEQKEKEKKKVDPDELDSQHWFENVKTLRFPSEIRVVGEEAVPVYELPPVDTAGAAVNPEEEEKLDMWKSTTLCLMDPDVTSFNVLSDGKYVYVFRQSRKETDTVITNLAKGPIKQKPPVDGNLLCDRFTLVGSTLNRALEVRYQRSRQKRLPLNDKDTLAVRDINDTPFYEPTFSMRFVRDMVEGRFTVLQTPTAVNEVMRWIIFAYCSRTNQLECISSDVASDGLFDIHGRIYYTCETGHKAVFSTAPGPCLTLRNNGDICKLAKKVAIPKPANSECSLIFNGAGDKQKEVDYISGKCYLSHY
jgi:hypothetical protein